MKPLLTLILMLGIASVSFADTASDLAALKKEFPEWTPPSTLSKYNPNDPMVRECVDKYKKTVEHTSPATIPQNVAYLRAQLGKDIENFTAIVATSERSKATGTQFFAARANLVWLKTKVKPFVDKLEKIK